MTGFAVVLACVATLFVLITAIMLPERVKEASDRNEKIKILAVAVVGVLLVAVLLFVGIEYVHSCDDCGKLFVGTSYYGWSGDEVLCPDCARDFWSPFPYRNYAR